MALFEVSSLRELRWDGVIRMDTVHLLIGGNLAQMHTGYAAVKVGRVHCTGLQVPEGYVRSIQMSLQGRIA